MKSRLVLLGALLAVGCDFDKEVNLGPTGGAGGQIGQATGGSTGATGGVAPSSGGRAAGSGGSGVGGALTGGVAPGSGGRAVGGTPGTGGGAGAPSCPAGCQFALEERVCGQELPPPAAVVCDGPFDPTPLLAAGCLIFPDAVADGGMVPYCCPVEMGNACASLGTGGTGSGGKGSGGTGTGGGPQGCAPGCSEVATEAPVGCPLDAQDTWMCQAGADPSPLVSGGCVVPRPDASTAITGLYCCTPEFSAQCRR